MLIFIVKAKSQGGIKKHINDLTKGLKELGHEVKVFNFSLSPFRLLKGIIQIRKEIREKKPDIIHFHGYRALVYSIFIPENAIFLCTIHGYLEIRSIASRITKLTLTFTVPKINHYICVSKALMNYFSSEFNVALSQITVVPNGIRLIECNIIRPSKPTIIGACGRLVDIKGYDILIKAFNKVREKNNVQLHLIGDGPNLKKLKKLAKKDVYFHGFKKNALEYMGFFHVFVQPSLLEGCGISVLEAMSLNLPVVVSDAGGLPELVIDKEDGLICKKGDVHDLEEKLEMIITNHLMYKALGMKNSEKISKSFSKGKMVDSTLSIYYRLLGDEVNEQIV